MHIRKPNVHNLFCDNRPDGRLSCEKKSDFCGEVKKTCLKSRCTCILKCLSRTLQHKKLLNNVIPLIYTPIGGLQSRGAELAGRHFIVVLLSLFDKQFIDEVLNVLVSTAVRLKFKLQKTQITPTDVGQRGFGDRLHSKVVQSRLVGQKSVADFPQRVLSSNLRVQVW